ncbi:MAG: DUF4290 domain-containing protein [Bacteroidales bacterium]
MAYDYNTQRKRMALPEYGRNVQKMVDYTKSITDDEERNRAAKTVIQIMGNLNPHLRDVGDFKHKLWDHLALIADFDLDIESPYPKPERSKFNEKPNIVDYTQGNIRYLHYGKIVEQMIATVTVMEEGEDKDYLISLILNQMKKSYITWNRSQVADEVIIADLQVLSRGKLKPKEGIKLLEVKELAQMSQQQQQNKKKLSGKPHNKQQNKKKKGFNKH